VGTVPASAAYALLFGAPNDGAGVDVAGGLDLTGDGSEDLIVGAHNSSVGGLNSGVAYVFDGATIGPGGGVYNLSLLSERQIGERASDYAGMTVAVGHVNADGVGDTLVGAYLNDAAASGAGAAYVSFGPATDGSLSAADARWTGAAASDQAGWGLALADLDADGLDEVLVGVPGWDGGAADGGGVAIGRLPMSGSISVRDADAWVTSADAGAYAGLAVEGVPDVDGDGYAELWIGAPYRDGYAGGAWLMRGPVDGDVTTAAAALTVEGEDAFGYVGGVLAAIEDVDGDLVPELTISSFFGTGEAAASGVVYLFRGDRTGTEPITAADATLDGERGSDLFGAAVVGWDGGLAVGAAARDAVGADSGAVYWFAGVGGP
jgi:hypothetical protein